MSNIPSANKSTKARIKRQNVQPTNNKILFSFEILNRTEYFDLDCTCENWSSDLFNMLKDVSSHTRVELNQIGTYRVHPHGNAKPPSKLPDGVELKDCWQLRISKSKGGIHGVFQDNIFYVIWLDPLHNMYPDDRYGGLRKVRAVDSCCNNRETIIDEKDQQIDKLIEELNTWKEIAEELEAKDKTCKK